MNKQEMNGSVTLISSSKKKKRKQQQKPWDLAAHSKEIKDGGNLITSDE